MENTNEVLKSMRLFLMATIVCVSAIGAPASAQQSKKIVYIEKGKIRYEPSEGKIRPSAAIFFDLRSCENFADKVTLIQDTYPNVRTVVLGGKFFDESQITTIHQLKNLKTVVLDSVTNSDSQKQIRTAYPNTTFVFSQCSAISILRRNNAEFTIEKTKPNVRFPEIDSCHMVSVVELGRSYGYNFASPQLNEAIIAQLQYLPSLVDLDMSETKISDTEVDELLRTLTLEGLNLRKTSLTGIGLKNLNGDHLNYLNLAKTPYAGKWIGSFSRLRTLDLRWTNITNDDVDYILQLQQLEHIYICGTKVDAVGLKKLAELGSLKSMIIDEKFRKNAIVRHLKSKIPKLEISFY